MRALLLAAGLGTRLKPLTDIWPKCLMPVQNRPLLEYWLAALKAIGIEQVLVNTHHHADEVAKFLDREQYSGWVEVSQEKKLLGTAKTLSVNADFFCGHRVLLIHADNWCPCDLSEFINFHCYRRPKNTLITMMTFETKHPQSCGIVEKNIDGSVKNFYEKVPHPPGNCANAAVYLLEPEVIGWLKHRTEVTDFSVDVIPRFLGYIATWNNPGTFRDIGTLSELRAAQNDAISSCKSSLKDRWQVEFEASSVFRQLLANINPERD